MLPFNAEQFFAIFAAYNADIWPMPLIAYGLGLLALMFLLQPSALADRTTSTVLGLMWLWTGVAYHWLHFAGINPAAYLFGAAFVMQALVIFYAGWTRQLAFGRVSGVRGAAGLALVTYAAILYPLLGLWLGHTYPALPVFGVTPCPVTIFTLGCLLLTPQPVPWWTVVIPVLWSLVGGSAAFLLAVPQDWLLLFSGVVTVAALLLSKHASDHSLK